MHFSLSKCNCVGESRGISQKELSARADKDQATLTKILDLLEKKNFIRREANPRDRALFFSGAH
ncbi:MarR family transcriptional regulator [Bacillus atrophaeus]|uniref:MarR family transcriptional regulator n=1 Tax=Bacillus atrophaeus TaxID=1452 RepID=UPI001CB97725